MRQIFIGCVGGFSYMICELLWRGKTHWSMFILGGICLVTVGATAHRMRGAPLFAKAAVGAACITALEFITGVIVNLRLHMHVWSYSDAPFNLLGQICLPYSALWFLLAPICIYAYDKLCGIEYR